ncbi:hypothetical protein GGR56DRAFT_674075 [Xylariaceae sp. FL0804]|nr:hypothetical protein GGR56DRAFT_674075 [Xylariaceae sp. FL0804]
MPQDPHLYGQRPAKKQKKEIPLSSSLAFTSQLSSLISAPSSTTGTNTSAATGRKRPSNKTKDDIFSTKAKRKPGAQGKEGAGKDDNGEPAAAMNGSRKGGSSSSNNKNNSHNRLRPKDVHGTEDEKQGFLRAKRNMQEKARLYAAMKRGDYIAREGEAAPLVDFDRKWAEKHPGEEDERINNSSSGSDNESYSDDDNAEDLVEYTDEFGRTRRGTRADAERQRRRAARSALGAAELEAMAGRPAQAPARVIHGDAIQTGAFELASAAAEERMAALAAGRDASASPPPDAHFDAGAEEARARGVGFYRFSARDEAARRAEMAALAAERAATERARAERAGERERRRAEIAARRREVGERRAARMADSFLDGLAGEMMATTTATTTTAAAAEEKGAEGEKEDGQVTTAGASGAGGEVLGEREDESAGEKPPDRE